MRKIRGTPAELLLPSQDLLPDLPVEEDDISVDDGSGGDPSPRNPGLEIRKELRRLNNTRYHDRTEGWYFGTGRTHPALAWSLRPRARITLRMVSRCGFPSTDRAL